LGKPAEETGLKCVPVRPEERREARVIAIHGNPGATFRDRRRRARVKVALRAHLRGGLGTLEVFEDVGKTIDVSRDGLLIVTPRGGYWIDQVVQVTCPYATTPTAINESRRARVVRTVLLPNLQFGVAVQFDRQVRIREEDQWSATPAPAPVRVLGVESDRGMVKVMSELLESDGYHVVFVESARQALEVLRHETPDVLVAEVEGHDICGHDLCAIVKKSERLRHIPVILMTGSGMPSDYASSHRLGAVMCIKRPCAPVRLQRAIHLVAAPPGHRSVYGANFNVSSYVRPT
jgi:CheY-like chemotaxis protein